jgi:hypothetical protein
LWGDVPRAKTIRGVVLTRNAKLNRDNDADIFHDC